MNQIEDKEYIRISDTVLEMSIITFGGKDGDYFIQYSPSLRISGYGKTPQEAEESMRVSIEAFALDLKKLSVKKRETVLNSLGWSKERFKSKNFSHAYIDKEGVIQGLGLELEDVRTTEMELQF